MNGPIAYVLLDATPPPPEDDVPGRPPRRPPDASRTSVRSRRTLAGMDFQSTLFAPAPLDRGFDFTGIDRRELTRGAWVDVARGWLPQADEEFAS